jgi:hypothetical protein
MPVTHSNFPGIADSGNTTLPATLELPCGGFGGRGAEAGKPAFVRVSIIGNLQCIHRNLRLSLADFETRADMPRPVKTTYLKILEERTSRLLMGIPASDCENDCSLFTCNGELRRGSVPLAEARQPAKGC